MSAVRCPHVGCEVPETHGHGTEVRFAPRSERTPRGSTPGTFEYALERAFDAGRMAVARIEVRGEEVTVEALRAEFEKWRSSQFE